MGVYAACSLSGKFKSRRFGQNLSDVFTVRLESESNIMPPVLAGVGGIKTSLELLNAPRCSAAIKL